MATTVSEYLSDIVASRNKIRNKLVNFGVSENTDKLAALADDLDGIANLGAISGSVVEGGSFTIAAGYTSGGTISGIAGGGNYELGTAEVTPSKSVQTVNPPAGKYGLSSVTVKKIPDEFQDVSNVTATASDVLTGKRIVTANGTEVVGNILNHGDVEDETLVAGGGYLVQRGYYHSDFMIHAKSLAEQTPTRFGSLAVTPESLREDYCAWINGEIVYGEMPDAEVSAEFVGNSNVAIEMVDLAVESEESIASDYFVYQKITPICDKGGYIEKSGPNAAIAGNAGSQDVCFKISTDETNNNLSEILNKSYAQGETAYFSPDNTSEATKLFSCINIDIDVLGILSSI